MDAIQFALLCSHDRKRYPKLEEYWKRCEKTLPFTVYMGYFKKNVNIQKFAELAKVDLIVLQSNKKEGYDWIVVNHPIVASNNLFFHYNPLEPISLNRVLVDRRKSEWNDPRQDEDLYISKIMIAPKKVEHYQLPFEIKIQTGSLMNNSEKLDFMKNLIKEMQDESGDEIVEFRSIRNFNLDN